jgi:hypothetical protein
MQVEKPRRVRRSFTQHLCAPAGTVFPLLCPVREMEWVNDWRPKLVITDSGVAEPGCIFVTPGIPEDALWLMRVHDPVEHHLEIIKIIPGMVIGTITVAIAADGEEACTADISYAYTALSEHGKRAIGEFTEEHFRGFMKTWETELNHFLRTGEKLVSSEPDRGE